MRTIGFFGGAFDPIHFGHISLAIQLLEINGLDEVLFCPAFCSPFKTYAPPVASPQHRLALLRLALERIPHFRITTLEIDRGGPSYTIDTLRALKGESAKLRLLMSEETASQFNLWKESEELSRIAPPLVGSRSPSHSSQRGYTPTKTMEISSTEIRARLKKGLYCGHLVPPKALDYIHSHRLYS
jgi:nicotinate-nucleotide adenylyltransferase